MIGDLVRRLVHKNSELENALEKERLIQQHVQIERLEEQERVAQDLKSLQSKADATRTSEESQCKKYDRLQKQYDEMREKFLAMIETLKEHHEKEIELKHVKWKEEINEMQKTFIAAAMGLEEKNNELRATFAEQDAELKALRADNEALSAGLQQLESDFQGVDDLMANIEELKTLYENEKDRNRNLQDLCIAWYIYFHRTSEQLQQIQSENVSYKAQIEELTNTLHEYQQQETGESSGSDDLMSGIKLFHDNAALSRQIRDLEYKNQELQDQVRKLQSESSSAAAGSLPDQAQQEIKRLNQLLQDSMKDSSGKRIIANLNNEISRLRFELKRREIFEDDIQGGKLQKANERIQELEQELQRRDKS